MSAFPDVDLKRWPAVRAGLVISGAVSFFAAFQLVVLAYGSGPWLGHFSKRELLKSAPVILWGCLVLFIATFAWKWARASAEKITRRMNQKRGAALPGWILVVLSWLVLSALLFLLPDQRLGKFLPLFWIFTHLSFLGALGLYLALPGKAYLVCLATIFLFNGATAEIISFLPDISTNPFTLGWSEGSRYFNASLFFARSLYGAPAPLPTLHPSRYILQSLPFLIPSLPLWFHRLWQVLLWLGCSWAGAALLTRRLSLNNRWLRILLTAWSFLFFFQGPVYYHLLLCGILVLWGFDVRRFWRSLVIILIASIWAGISRINWFPVPGLLAALIYFLEVRQDEKPFWRYLIPPSAWFGAGLAAAFVSQAIYILVSGNDKSLFGSSLTSSLLWYRLFPSATYPVGILSGIAWAALPLLAAVLIKVWAALPSWKPVRWVGPTGILAIFFLGGIVVSVKIGGGSNLHNLDAFLVLLLVAGVYIIFGAFRPDYLDRTKVSSMPWWLLALVIFIPVVQAVPDGLSFSRMGSQEIQNDITTIQRSVDQNRSKTILFIDNRQLLTFGYLDGVRLVPEYEKVFLMEMAMANNRGYLDAFETDLRQHRFSLIVTETLNPVMQSRNHNFSEENNAWVEHVSIPILQYYQEKVQLKDIGVQILVPRP